MSEEETIKEVKKTIEKIRPFINRDGGDIEFDKLVDGVVYVKFLGACQGCNLISSTLENGVEVIIMEEVPGIVAVKVSE